MDPLGSSGRRLPGRVLPQCGSGSSLLRAAERPWLAGGWPVDALRVGYRTAAIALLPLALVGYVVAPWRRPHGWAGAWVVGAAAAVAVLSRIGLLALVDSTSFPAIANAPYSLPAPG